MTPTGRTNSTAPDPPPGPPTLVVPPEIGLRHLFYGVLIVLAFLLGIAVVTGWMAIMIGMFIRLVRIVGGW